MLSNKYFWDQIGVCVCEKNKCFFSVGKSKGRDREDGKKYLDMKRRLSRVGAGWVRVESPVMIDMQPASS